MNARIISKIFSNRTSMMILTIFIVLAIGNVSSFVKLTTTANSKTQNRLGSLNMKVMDHIDALLFDCDGVIAETERDVHRISFNEAFKNQGLTNEWNVELYGELLKIGGGKERMTAYFNNVGWPSKVPESERKNFIQGVYDH